MELNGNILLLDIIDTDIENEDGRNRQELLEIIYNKPTLPEINLSTGTIKDGDKVSVIVKKIQIGSLSEEDKVILKKYAKDIDEGLCRVDKNEDGTYSAKAVLHLRNKTSVIGEIKEGGRNNKVVIIGIIALVLVLMIAVNAGDMKKAMIIAIIITVILIGLMIKGREKNRKEKIDEKDSNSDDKNLA